MKAVSTTKMDCILSRNTDQYRTVILTVHFLDNMAEIMPGITELDKSLESSEN